MMEKIVPDPFLKYRTSKNLWINNLRFYAICFYCMSNSRAIKLYWSWAGDHLLCCYIKVFQKKKEKKRGQVLVSLPYFVHDFWKKLFLIYILLNDQNLLSAWDDQNAVSTQSFNNWNRKFFKNEQGLCFS